MSTSIQRLRSVNLQFSCVTNVSIELTGPWCGASKAHTIIRKLPEVTNYTLLMHSSDRSARRSRSEAKKTPNEGMEYVGIRLFEVHTKLITSLWYVQ